jgi:hypothetical protein
MRLLRYACPHCGGLHRIGLLSEQTHCIGCSRGIALTPGMFSSRICTMTFVAGALGLGVALGRLRWSLGKLPYDADQLFLDIACFWIYAWFCRIVYFQFQSVEVVL